jgi:prevent-host-death family protein
MNAVAVSHLRNHLQEYLLRIQRGEKIVITSRGKEVALLIPHQSEQSEAKKILKQLSKTAIVGDVLSPIDSYWSQLVPVIW